VLCLWRVATAPEEVSRSRAFVELGDAWVHGHGCRVVLMSGYGSVAARLVGPLMSPGQLPVAVFGSPAQTPGPYARCAGSSGSRGRPARWAPRGLGAACR
jgi:hypothetical protein